MSTPLKIGVVGCGWAGQQAVLAAAAVDRTQVVAISDLEETLIQQTLKQHPQHPVPRQYGPYQDLLNDPEVEAVYLAVNPVMRYPMVFDALAAGKHVLIQKPHAVRAEHLLAFEKAAAQAGRQLQYCYFMRHFPRHRRIRAAVQRGDIGDPYHARIFLKFNVKPAPEGITLWQQVYGQKGGALAQHASHELDLAWWWMGCPAPQWAFATKHIVNPAYDGPEGQAEDYLSGLVGLDGGKVLQVDCSRWLHADTSTVVELYGTEGAITQQGTLSHFTNHQYHTQEVDAPLDIQYSQPPANEPCFYYEMEHFAMALAGETRPDPDAAEAYQFMRILDGLYDSARASEKVTIE